MIFGFSFEGGGGKGGFSAGISYGLREKGIKPAVIHSISVGALNGAMIATGQYEAMKKVWHTVTDDDVRKERKLQYKVRMALHLAGLHDPHIGYWSNQPLKDLVRKHLINKSFKCDFYAGAVRVRDNKFVNFYFPKHLIIHEGNVDEIVDKIVASTAIPMIFEPVIIDGDKYVDGGVHYQMPLKQIGDSKCDYIIGVSHSQKGQKADHNIRDDIGMTKWTIEAQLGQTSSYEYERFERINHMCKNGLTTDWNGKERKYYPNTIFRPTQELSPSTRFHHKFGKKDFEHGREIAQSFNHEKITS